MHHPFHKLFPPQRYHQQESRGKYNNFRKAETRFQHEENIIWILHHSINRNKKQHESWKHPWDSIERIKQRWGTFLHVFIHWKINSHQWMDRTDNILWCCEKSERTSKKGTKHFLPISHVWMDTRDTHHVRHVRKWIWRLKLRKIQKLSS